MKLDIDGVQAFVLVSERANFRKAAEELGLTQTALTRRIQNLESYLGLKLLDRTTRSVTLTTVGREFLPQAKRIVEELTLAIGRLKHMSRAASGDVTLACIASLAYQRLPAIVRSYAKAHPGNRVCILDRTGAHVGEAVKQGHADFGLTILPTREPELLEEPVLQDPFVLYCLKSHPMSRVQRATWEDLRGIDLITFGGASGNRTLIEHQLSRKGVDVRSRFEVEQLSTAVGLVRAGVGAAILTASTLLAETYPSMRQVPLVNPVVKRAVGLVGRRGNSLAPAAQALYDLIARELRRVPATGGRRHR